MLAIECSGPETTSCVPNVIPCRLHHDGPTKVTKRYWTPSNEKANLQTAYFRGRKLRGRTIKLPAGFKGLILQKTGKVLPQLGKQPLAPQYDSEDEDDLAHEDAEPTQIVQVLEKLATFDELSVWGHDQLPATDDPFVKNVEEWLALAVAIHGTSNPSSNSSIVDVNYKDKGK